MTNKKVNDKINVEEVLKNISNAKGLKANDIVNVDEVLKNISNAKGRIEHYENGQVRLACDNWNAQRVEYYGNGEVKYVQDAKGNEVWCSQNGQITGIHSAELGVECSYYEDGTLKEMVDKDGRREYDEKGRLRKFENEDISRRYREDGTLESERRGDRSRHYAADGKTVDGWGSGDNTYDGIYRVSYRQGKFKAESHYEGDDEPGSLHSKMVEGNYNADGSLNNWTVTKETENDVGSVVSQTTYKKDDVRAITSGDVPGFAYLEGNRPEYFDGQGEAVWAKEAKAKASKKIDARKTAKTTQKKATAMALRVQKEKQNVQGLTANNNFGAQWVTDAQKKVATKTAQRAKTAASAKIKKTTKANNGRS